MFRNALLTLLGLALASTAFAAGGGAGAGSAGGHAAALTVSTFGVRELTGESHLGQYLKPGEHTNPDYPFFGVWGGFGGDMPPSFYYQFYGIPPLGYYVETTPAGPGQPMKTTLRPEPQVTLANEFPATLYLQLPGAGEVWVNGQKSADQPGTEWTLTSPTLQAGQSYSFEVKARWTVDGKAYEYTRTVAVESGNESRVTVLSGTLLAK